MKKGLPAYVYRKSGKYLYFEKPGSERARIYAQPGTAEFQAEYTRLLLGSKPAQTHYTFKALVASYRRSRRWKGLSARSQSDYAKVLDWVMDKLGPYDVRDFRRPDLIRARDANAETLRFANYIVQVVRILLEQAIDLGWIRENPAKGVPLLKSDGPGREPWPTELIEAYRAKATGRALLVFELCLGTGQRIGDVLRMRWDAIEDGGITLRQGKTGTELWIPLTARLSAALAATPRVGLTICAQPNGRPTSYRGAADLVMKVRREIGAEAYDIHSLRYATTAELAALGCGDDLIQAVTGHKSTAMVAKYAGKARQKARAIAAQAAREQNKSRT